MRRTITIPIPRQPLKLIAGLTLCGVAFAIWPSLAAEPDSGPIALRLASPLLAPGVDETTLLIEVTAPTDMEVERRPVALALIVDTSTSMAGNKLANARKAARETVLAMGKDDRLTLVAFGSDAAVLARDMPVGENRLSILAAIDGLESSGHTCMACGLEAGWDGLRRTEASGARTALVISDGAITAGLDNPDELKRMADTAFESGIRTTTIGLGRDYDPVSIRAVAEGGGGLFYFAHNSALLAKYARHEVDLTRRAALSDAVVTVEPTPGITLEAPVAGKARLTPEGRLRLKLGRMAPGERRQVLVPARMLGSAEVGAIEATIRARTPRGGWVADAPGIGLERTKDIAAAEASVDHRVAVARMHQSAAAELDLALAELGAGEITLARRRLKVSVDRLTALRETSGSATLDEPMKAARDVLDNIMDYAPGSDALITARRANEGVRYEWDLGHTAEMNSVNRGAGLFRWEDLE